MDLEIPNRACLFSAEIDAHHKGPVIYCHVHDFLIAVMIRCKGHLWLPAESMNPHWAIRHGAEIVKLSDLIYDLQRLFGKTDHALVSVLMPLRKQS